MINRFGDADSQPTPDFNLSPHTGWHRGHWTQLADRLISGVLPFMSQNGCLVELPGKPSRHGRHNDALEGFARSFALVALRVAAEPARLHDPTIHPAVERYAQGLTNGPGGGRDRWPHLGDHTHSLVEAASLAIALHVSRKAIWDYLDSRTQERICEWLAGGRNADTWHNNHLLFPATVASFLHSVGYHDSKARRHIDRNLDMVDAMYVGDGWYTDGGTASFDYYNSWALHYYPLLCAEMAGMPERTSIYRGRLGDFFQSHAHFFTADGAPLYFGRSLTYRVAAATAAWMAAGYEVDGVSPGLARRLASGCAAYFDAHGSFATPPLSLGWHGPCRSVVQRYSGPSSPYWISKGFYGLRYGPDHPIWTDVEQPLPAEIGDFRQQLRSPRMLLVSHQEDRISQLVPYGVSHGVFMDDRHYNRLMYSSETSPVLGTPDLGDATLRVRGLFGTYHLRRVTSAALAYDAVFTRLRSYPQSHRRRLNAALARFFPWRQTLDVVAIPIDSRIVWVIRVHSRERKSVLSFGGYAVAGDQIDAHLDPAAQTHSASAMSGRTRSQLGVLLNWSVVSVPKIDSPQPFGARAAFPLASDELRGGCKLYVAVTDLARSERSVPDHMHAEQIDGDMPVVRIQWDSSAYDVEFDDLPSVRISSSQN